LDKKTVWFAEPDQEDNSLPVTGENTFSWIARSSSEKAKHARRFLNENMNQVPINWQGKLFGDFRTKEWNRVFFELIVARTLQLLGASIEVEVPIAETNRRPDFVAQFPDGVITVEATVPEINARINQQSSENEELIQIIEALIPPSWSVVVWRLPRLGARDSKKKFKRTIQESFSRLPSNPAPSQNIVELELDCGELKLSLIPGRKGERASSVRGTAFGADDTEEKIRAIVTRKKKQVRKANMPVLLAVSTSPFGEREDYDRALFGLTYELTDRQGKTVSIGFDPVGLFAVKRPESPTFAGVLAFTKVGFRRVADPIFYLHPRFHGRLPNSLEKLEQRTYREGKGVSVRRALEGHIARTLQPIT